MVKGSWYPTEDAKAPVARKHKNLPTKLRGNIAPGSVLIILAGKHEGKRVVFLKQLGSGQLLVTGPYKLNGVPLKRIPQCFTLPTSTKVDVSAARVSDVDDAYFVSKKAKKTDGPLVEAKSIPAEKKTKQVEVDKAVLSKVSGLVKKYLGTRFALSNGQYPHQLKF
jgi:large subunit ribosomal protein L6e